MVRKVSGDGQTAAEWSGERVLVTGASGFLGGRLMGRLVAEGAEVTSLTRPGSGSARHDTHCRWAEADPMDAQQLGRVFAAARPSAVFHAGAQPLVGAALEDPGATFEANIRATWALCEAALSAGSVTSFVLVSSERVYGDGPEPVCTEDTALRGRHPYDVSKACGELVVQSYAATLGLQAGIVRLTNLFGQGDLNLQRLIPGTLVSALRGEPPVLRSDGRGQRDFLHVDEAIEAMLRLARALTRRDEALTDGTVVNIASGRPRRIIDVVRDCLVAAGRSDLVPRIRADVPDRSGTRPVSVAKARQILGWQPADDMAAALADTVRWYAAHMERSGVRP